MAAFATVSWRAAVLGRWTARILGTLMVLLYLTFLIGEGPPNPAKLSATERLSFLCTGTMLAGLLAAWKWEGLGGSLAIAGFGGLLLISTTYLRAWGFYIPAGVGLLHLLAWLRLRSGSTTGFR